MTDDQLKVAFSQGKESREAFLILGQMILDRTKALSVRVNTELLSPISKWLDDPDWLKKFSTVSDASYPWAAYKRVERRYLAQKREDAAMRLKQYWCEIRRRKFIKDVTRLIPKGAHHTIGSPPPTLEIAHKNLSPVLSPFSVGEQKAAAIDAVFTRFMKFPVSRRLPWRQMVSGAVSCEKKLSALDTWYAKDIKKDRISKFMAALELEAEGELRIYQKKPFDEIQLSPAQKSSPADIFLMDQAGRDYHFDWHKLNTPQQQKIVSDIEGNRLVLKPAPAIK